MDRPIPLDEAWARLVARLSPLAEGGVLVAFSGGLDSAVLLDAAVETLGAERVLAFTAVSPSLPRAELEAARRFAAEVGARLYEEPTSELSDPDYVANAGNRCYFCKRELFSVMDAAKSRLGLSRVVYGYHRDDDADVRPGLRAALEAGALRPLWDAGLGKADLRALARARGRSFAGKGSMACLSSRIPVGTPVTEERLRKVETLEAWMRERGYRQFRARLDSDDHVRLVTSPDEVGRLTAEVENESSRRSLLDVAAAVGVVGVSVDPRGYQRSGEP